MDAVFLDRDGVINVNRPDHVRSWEQFQFLPGALIGLRRLQHAGIPLIVVTNQAAVGRGMMDGATVDDIHHRLRRIAAAAGASLLDILYCPHRPEDRCRCRKPQPGMLHEAARRYGLNLRRCAIVGDARSDVQAGLAVGCIPVMVETGRGGAEHRAAQATGFYGYQFVRDLSAAAEWLLALADDPESSTLTSIAPEYPIDTDLQVR